ncbi:hypothetical protein L7F22_022984 [Adiantum nelumboides]|nr:hypothetical protein [Adiantum nelumboides]
MLDSSFVWPPNTPAFLADAPPRACFNAWAVVEAPGLLALLRSFFCLSPLQSPSIVVEKDPSRCAAERSDFGALDLCIGASWSALERGLGGRSLETARRRLRILLSVKGAGSEGGVEASLPCALDLGRLKALPFPLDLCRFQSVYGVGMVRLAAVEAKICEVWELVRSHGSASAAETSEASSCVESRFG